jgi:hypothetical protein
MGKCTELLQKWALFFFFLKNVLGECVTDRRRGFHSVAASKHLSTFFSFFYDFEL